MSVIDIFNVEYYKEYDLIYFASGKAGKPNLFKKFLHVARRPTKELFINSKKMTKIIKQFDTTFYNANDDHIIDIAKGVTTLSQDQINIPNDETITYIKKYVLKHYENNKDPVKIDKWDKTLKDAAINIIASPIIKEAKEKYNFVVQNAYYAYDYYSKKEYHHVWHQDDVGFRLKLWVILDSNGEIGIHWAPLSMKELKERIYGENRFVFCEEPIFSKFQPSLPKLSYLLNTDCFHRGSISKGSSRLAFVVELINHEKMLKINGIAPACHFNPDTINL